MAQSRTPFFFSFPFFFSSSFLQIIFKADYQMARILKSQRRARNYINCRSTALIRTVICQLTNLTSRLHNQHRIIICIAFQHLHLFLCRQIPIRPHIPWVLTTIQKKGSISKKEACAKRKTTLRSPVLYPYSQNASHNRITNVSSPFI